MVFHQRYNAVTSAFQITRQTRCLRHRHHRICSNSTITRSGEVGESERPSPRNESCSINRTQARPMKKADLQSVLGENGVAFRKSETRESLRRKLLELIPPKFPRRRSDDDESTLDDGASHDNPHAKEEDNGAWPVVAALDLVESEMWELDPTHSYVIRMKGHSRMNCNGTGVGLTIHDADQLGNVRTARKHLSGDRSFSHAEYTAVIVALKYARSLGIRKIDVETNHELLYNQLSGNFPLIKDSLQPFYWRVKSLMEFEFESASVALVGPEMMKEALQLATTALATGRSFNMTHVVDPMGAKFQGMGKQRNENSLPPVTANDGEVAEIDPDKTYLLQFDGGARGNPCGKSGMGMVIYDDKRKEIWCGWQFLGPMSNNLAEYNALLGGLLCAYSLGIRKIKVEGDSELVIKQLRLEYNVRNANLKDICVKTLKVLSQFHSFELHHIDRSRNKRADALANYAMDFESSYGFAETNNLQLWVQ